MEQTLTIKNMELRNQALELQVVSLTDQVNQFGLSSPSRKGSASSSSMPMSTIPEEVKEQRINIFQPGAQIKRSAGGSQRTD